MNSYPEIPDQYLKLLQILHLSLGFAIVPLSILIPAVAGTAMPSEGDYITIQSLSLVHAFVFMSSLLAAGIVIPRMMQASKDRLQTATIGERDAAWSEWLEAYKRSHIIALSMREGPALLGLVTLLLASINGVLWEHSYFWMNYFSSAMFILFIVLSFPTADKITTASRM